MLELAAAPSREVPARGGSSLGPVSSTSFPRNQLGELLEVLGCVGGKCELLDGCLLPFQPSRDEVSAVGYQCVVFLYVEGEALCFMCGFLTGRGDLGHIFLEICKIVILFFFQD